RSRMDGAPRDGRLRRRRRGDARRAEWAGRLGPSAAHGLHVVAQVARIGAPANESAAQHAVVYRPQASTVARKTTKSRCRAASTALLGASVPRTARHIRTVIVVAGGGTTNKPLGDLCDAKH